MHNLKKAQDFCILVEQALQTKGIKGHVALTGGTLYKDGPRKDIDIIIYSEDTNKEVNQVDLFEVWLCLGCYAICYYGRVTKMKYKNLLIDVIQPCVDGIYEQE